MKKHVHDGRATKSALAIGMLRGDKGLAKRLAKDMKPKHRHYGRATSNALAIGILRSDKVKSSGMVQGTKRKAR